MNHSVVTVLSAGGLPPDVCLPSVLRVPRAVRLRRFALRCLLALACVVAATGLLPRAAHAQASAASCWVSSSGYLDFGAVDLFGGNTDAVLSVSYTCGVSAAKGTGVGYLRLCLGLGTGSGGTTYAPRLMLASNDGSGLTLQYNFYTDAARTVIIGSDSSGSYTPLNLTLQVPVTSYYATASGTINLYGRIPTGQGDRLSSPYTYYQSTFSGTASVLKYAWSASATPASCNAGTGTGSVTLGLQVAAHIQSGCFISTATDLNFGQSATLGANTDQTSAIGVACSGNTTWQIGLSNGMHYANGTRNMVGPLGALIHYQLYRDAAHTQLWGNTLNTDTVSGAGTTSSRVNVYGRVPSQSNPAAGAYSDTVTVTLTY